MLSNRGCNFLDLCVCALVTLWSKGWTPPDDVEPGEHEKKTRLHSTLSTLYYTVYRGVIASSVAGKIHVKD